jgi:uncharacterized protein (TIGR02300 family)
VTKPEWGTKRACLSCGARFYDMKKSPINCPKCGAKFDPEQFAKPSRRGGGAAEKPKPAPAPAPKAVAVEDIEDVEPVEGEDEEEEAEDLLEDASDLGEDDDDMAEVMEHLDEEEAGEP